VIEHLGRLLEEAEPELIATCCYLEADPATAAVRWSSAGHLPALALAPDGTVRWLEGAQAAPLGVPRCGPVGEASATLAAGSLLLLYTDGLVERRGESLEAGLRRLELALRPRCGGLAEHCDLLLAELVADRPADDEVALLVLRFGAGSDSGEPSRSTGSAPRRAQPVDVCGAAAEVPQLDVP
jgi:serine phosphatase RsbU (regulator of sigma subunit)